MSHQQQSSVKDQVKRWAKADKQVDSKEQPKSIVSLKSSRPPEKIEERVLKQRKRFEKALLKQRSGVFDTKVEKSRVNIAPAKTPTSPKLKDARKVVTLTPTPVIKRIPIVTTNTETTKKVQAAKQQTQDNFTLVPIEESGDSSNSSNDLVNGNEEVGVGASTLFHETEVLVDPYDSQ